MELICCVCECRCCWAVSNHDFVEAYNCQAIVIQYPLLNYRHTNVQKIRADYCD